MIRSLLRIANKPMVSVLGGAILLAIPVFFPSRYVLHVFTMVFTYAVLVLSYNFVAGFANQFSLAHAAFYGIGAYTSAILSVRFGLSFWLGAPCGGLMAALVGIVLGLPTLRLRELYLTLATLAFGQAVTVVLVNWVAVTRGPFGIPNIPVPSIAGHEFDSRAYYYLSLFLLVLTYAVLARVLDSRTGRALIALGQDQEVAAAMGVDTTLYRLFAFSFSAFFAGVAGSFYAHYITFISADSFTLAETIAMLAMMVLGGMASLPGSVVGPAILIVASETLRSLYDYRMLIYGVIVIAVILLRPSGLLGGYPIPLRRSQLAVIRDRLGLLRGRSGEEAAGSAVVLSGGEANGRDPA